MHYAYGNVLPHDVCDQIVSDAEQTGFSESPVRSGSSEIMRKDIRNNSRVVFTPNKYFIAALKEKLLVDLVPREYKGMKFSRLNDVFRLYKYEDGQYFRPHKDGSIELATEETQLTILIYLSDCNSGATLAYPYGMQQLWSVKRMQCRKGYCLVFDHDMWHEGEEVIGLDTKYVLRTDAFYFKN